MRSNPFLYNIQRKKFYNKPDPHLKIRQITHISNTFSFLVKESCFLLFRLNYLLLLLWIYFHTKKIGCHNRQYKIGFVFVLIFHLLVICYSISANGETTCDYERKKLSVLVSVFGSGIE